MPSTTQRMMKGGSIFDNNSYDGVEDEPYNFEDDFSRYNESEFSSQVDGNKITSDAEECSDIESTTATVLFDGMDEEEVASCEDVRRLAKELAPQVAEFEERLKETSYEEGNSGDGQNLSYLSDNVTGEDEYDVIGDIENDMHNDDVNADDGDDDDHLDDEWKQLALSEELLRQELEFAQEFSTHLMAMSSPTSTDMASTVINSDTENRPSSAIAYTLQDHANFLNLKTEPVGGWYYVDMSEYLVGVGTPIDTNNNSNNDGVQISPQKYADLIKDYCIPIPFRKLKRVFAGVYHTATTNTIIKKKKVPTKPPPAPNSTRPPPSPNPPTGKSLLSKKSNNNNNKADDMFSASNTQNQQPQDEPLPFRTVTIRIRPDVLCGAVMDAVNHALDVFALDRSRVLKRQGGHLRGVVIQYADTADNGTPSPSPSSPSSPSPSKIQNKTVLSSSQSYVIDAQLCTAKPLSSSHGITLERQLVLRFYHIADDAYALQDIVSGGWVLPSSSYRPNNDTTNADLVSDDNAANSHLKEASSLIQRLMAQSKDQQSDPDQQQWRPSLLGMADNSIFSSRKELQQAIGHHLQVNYRACSSVRDENKKLTPTTRRLTLPSLSDKDFPLVEASWSLVRTVWEELETRDCTYNTLATLPFGSFPSLPTCDVHYCSQLRRLSRESMLAQLIKSAQQLDDYATSAELQCGHLLALLHPTLEYYQVPEPELPITKALEEYPLDFTPPQTTCPPWGAKVMEALNQIAANSTSATAIGISDDNDESKNDTRMSAETAVQMVFSAFNKQDDEEQGARLGRKNAQVMDRLAAMQSYQREIIHSIRESHIHSKLAQQAADDFVIQAQSANNIGKPGHPRMLVREVPLLQFRIVVGGGSSSGTCYVTASQVLFATSYIPLVGGVKRTLLDLENLVFEVDDNVTSTMLNPFPNTVDVVYATEEMQQSVYAFRPSIGPSRLVKCIKVIQEFYREEKDRGKTRSEFSRAVPDIVEEDGILRLTDTISEDQLSV